MAKEYLNAFINNSATIRGTLKANLTGAPHKAVVFDSDGTVKLPANDGDPAVGFILSDAAGGTDGTMNAGEEVDILIKDIGLGEASAAIAKGALVSVTTAGKLATATAGDFVLGIAMTAAAAAGDLVQVQITKSGYVPVAASAIKLGDLSDVDLTTPATDGQVLKYDNNTSKWKAAADATE